MPAAVGRDRPERHRVRLPAEAGEQEHSGRQGSAPVRLLGVAGDRRARLTAGREWLRPAAHPPPPRAEPAAPRRDTTSRSSNRREMCGASRPSTAKRVPSWTKLTSSRSGGRSRSSARHRSPSSGNAWAHCDHRCAPTTTASATMAHDQLQTPLSRAAAAHRLTARHDRGARDEPGPVRAGRPRAARGRGCSRGVSSRLTVDMTVRFTSCSWRQAFMDGKSASRPPVAFEDIVGDGGPSWPSWNMRPVVAALRTV
jgi:hypothetical protein